MEKNRLILCRRTPEEPGGSMRQKKSDMTERLHFHFSLFTFMHWRRKWQPTPVFLPGESQGWRSLVGCHLWRRTESETTEVTYQQQQQQRQQSGILQNVSQLGLIWYFPHDFTGLVDLGKRTTQVKYKSHIIHTMSRVCVKSVWHHYWYC